jgi:hypothetical protein
MTHHLQFSYSSVFDVLELLNHLKFQVTKFQPEHIAIGVLEQKTHVFLELLLPIRLQGLSQKFFAFQEINPSKFEKNVKNYIPFQKKFSQQSPQTVIHHFRRADQSVAHKIEELKTKVNKLQKVNERLISQNIFLKRRKQTLNDLSCEREILSFINARPSSQREEIRKSLNRNGWKTSTTSNSQQQLSKKKKTSNKTTDEKSSLALNVLTSPTIKEKLQKNPKPPTLKKPQPPLTRRKKKAGANKEATTAHKTKKDE